MASSGSIGYGAKLKRGNGASPQVFTAVAEVRKISGVGSKRGLVDFTNLDSLLTSMEYKLAMKDGQEFTAECNWIPDSTTQDQSAGMVADHDNGTVRDFQITLPAGLSAKKVSFSALVLGWSLPEVNPQGALIIQFNGKFTGPITIA
jgi:hypothetical protein